MALSEGDKLGPYKIVGLIGKGGMGEVYREVAPIGWTEKAASLDGAAG